MSTQSNYIVFKCFTTTNSINNQKTRIFNCKVCDHFFAHNITRMTAHLINCTSFLKHNDNVSHFFVLIKKTTTMINLKRKIEKNYENFSKRQTSFNVQIMSKNQLQHLHTFLNKTIFENDKILNLFELKLMLKFLYVFNSIYKLFSKKIIANSLLNQKYDNKKIQMQRIFNDCFCINYTNDEVSNVNQKRIINFTKKIKNYEFFHLIFIDMFFFEHSTKQLTSRLTQMMTYWSNNKFENINFFCTNDVVAMKKMWKLLNDLSTFKHVFFLSCDNHDVQLLIKNIVIKLSWFVQLFQKTQIVKILFWIR